MSIPRIVVVLTVASLISAPAQDQLPPSPDESRTGIRPAAQPELATVELGDYHALLVANETYEHFDALRTPVEDVEALAVLLTDTYGFRTRTLKNAGRREILDALDELVDRLSENDNLLIYYAGHGHVEERTGEGFWLPVTARPRRRSEWISNDEVRDTAAATLARNVLIVADSCFSGTLTRSTEPVALTPMTDVAYAKLYWQRSRTALTSGGLEPVDDAGSEGHSVFAFALLTALRENRRPILEASALHQAVRRPVMLNSSNVQEPRYADVRNTAHEGGDFLFVRNREEGERVLASGVGPEAGSAAPDEGGSKLPWVIGAAGAAGAAGALASGGGASSTTTTTSIPVTTSTTTITVGSTLALVSAMPAQGTSIPFPPDITALVELKVDTMIGGILEVLLEPVPRLARCFDVLSEPRLVELAPGSSETLIFRFGLGNGLFGCDTTTALILDARLRDSISSGVDSVRLTMELYTIAHP